MANKEREVEAITIISMNAEDYMNCGGWQARPLQRGSTAVLDLQNLPIDPAEVASQEHNEALKMRAAGASAVPAPKRPQ